MSRWKKPEEEITDGAKTMRDWIKTDKGEEYRKRSAEYAKEWRKKNKDKFKATQKKAYTKARLEVLSHYSGKENPDCACCQESDVRFLQIDHVNNDGAQHRREIGMPQSDSNQMKKEGRKSSIGGNGFVYWLKKNNFPEGFQVLCANCNYGKKNYGECPHKLGE